MSRKTRYIIGMDKKETTMTNPITTLWNKQTIHGKRLFKMIAATALIAAPVGVAVELSPMAQIPTSPGYVQPVEVAAAPAAPAELPICSTTPTYSMAPSAPCRPAPVEVAYEMTWEEATREMCEAVEQYRADVARFDMTRNEAFRMIREYAAYLASKSELDAKTLRDNGTYAFRYGARYCF